MAVNDLMMRIQLLVDSGKSSAELGRVAKSLTDFTKRLDTLKATKIDPLKDTIKSLADVQKQLKTVGLDNYNQSLTDLTQSFKKLGVQTRNLDSLRTAFDGLKTKQASGEIARIKNDLGVVRDNIKAVKDEAKNGLLFIDERTAYNLRDAKRALNDVNADLKAANSLIRDDRKEVAGFRKELNDSAKGFAALPANFGMPSLADLKRDLKDSQERVKRLAKELSVAKENAQGYRDTFKSIQKEASQVTVKKALDGLIPDTAKNVVDIRKVVAEVERLNKELADNRKSLTATKQQTALQRSLNNSIANQRQLVQQNTLALQAQKIELQKIEERRLKSLQLTQQEADKIRLLTGDRGLQKATLSIDTKEVDRLKQAILGIKASIQSIRARDFSNLANDVKLAAKELDNAKSQFNQLRSAAKLAALEAKQAKLIDPNELKKVTTELATAKYWSGVSSQAIATTKSRVRELRNELSLIKPEGLKTINEQLAYQRSILSQAKKQASDYRNELAQIKQDQRLSKQFLLPEQAGILAELNNIKKQLRDVQTVGDKSLLGLSTSLRQAQVEAEKFRNTELLPKLDSLKQAQQLLRDFKLQLPQQSGLTGYQDQLAKLREPIVQAQARLRDLRVEMQNVGKINYNQSFGSYDNLLKAMDGIKSSMTSIRNLDVGKTIRVVADPNQIDLINRQRKGIELLKASYESIWSQGGFKKQSENVQSAFRSTLDLVKQLDPALKKVFTVNTNQTTGLLEFENAFKRLSEAEKQANLGKESTIGLTALQNKIRELASEQKVDVAKTVEPINARVKSYNSELNILGKILDQYKKAEKARGEGSSDAKYTARAIELANRLAAATGNSIGLYNTEAAIKTRIKKLDEESLFGKLQSALNAEKISKQYKEQLATLKQTETIGRNQLNNYGAQLKEISALLSAERNRANLAKQAVKFGAGGIVDTQGLVNSGRAGQATLKNLIAGAKEWQQAFIASENRVIQGLRNTYESAKTEYEKMSRGIRATQFDIKIGRLDSSVLKQQINSIKEFGKTAAESYAEPIGNLLRLIGLTRDGISLRQAEIRGLNDQKVAAKDAAEAQKLGIIERLRGLAGLLSSQERVLNASKAEEQAAKASLQSLKDAATIRAASAQQSAINAAKATEAFSSEVTARNEALKVAKQALKEAKDQQAQDIAGLRVKQAQAELDKANAALAVQTTRNKIRAIDAEIAAEQNKGKERAKAIREEQTILNAKIASSKVASLGDQRKLTDLKGQLDRENAAQRQAIQLLQDRRTIASQSLTEQRTALEGLIRTSQQLYASDKAKALLDIDAGNQAVKTAREKLQSARESVLANKEQIASFKEGLKEYEKGLRQQIVAAQEKIASNQLTKQQLQDERKIIRDEIKDYQQLNKAFQDRLAQQQKSLQAELRIEEKAISNAQRAITDAQKLSKIDAERITNQEKLKLAQATSRYESIQKQITESNALAKSELSRLAALEKIAQQTNSLSSIFRRLNGSASVEPAIQATQKLITNVTEQLKKFGEESTLAKQKLSTMGATSDLPNIKRQIKDVQEQLKNLRSIGLNNLAPSQGVEFVNLRDTLKNLREQQKLLTQIAQIDMRTQAGQAESKQLNEQLKGLRAYASEMGRVSRFMQGFGFNLSAEMLGMSAFQTVTSAIHRMSVAFIEANSKAETLIRGLDAVFGKGQGDIQYEKLTALANKYGLGLQDLSRNYLQLNASAKGTILEGQESEKIFRSLSAAMAVLGADTISTQRAFRAVSQMISKGQVYAEELKGQLAESLPGAIQLFARSMGKTTQEFLAMVKAGQVGLNELIPFFKLVEQEYGNAAVSSSTWEQSINRIGNAWLELSKKIGDTGAWKILVGLADTYGRYVKEASDAFGDTNQQSLVKLRIEEANLAKPIQIPTELEFANLKELEDQVSGKKFKVYGQFVAENRGQLVTQIEQENAANQGKLEILRDQIAERQKMANLEGLKASDEEIRGIKALINQYQDFETFSQQFIKDYQAAQNTIFSKANVAGLLPIVGDALRTSLSLPSDSEIQKAFAEYQAQVLYARQRLQAAERENVQLRSSTEEEKLDTQRINRTKQQIAATKNYLNLQQQAYYALSTIQSTLDQRDGKASGLADSLINEYKATQVLARAYEELARAKSIEGSIKRDQENKKDNTTPEQIKEIRQLTIDQLKQAMTVARTANNYSLIVSLLSEISRVQNDINLDEMTQSTRDVSTASEGVLKQQEGFKKNLRDSATAGFGFARSIYQSLTATEQLNRLLSAQKVLNAQNAQEIMNAARSYQDAKRQAEANEKAVKKSQQDEGIYFTDAKKNADYAYMAKREAFAQAEEQISQAKLSRDAEEKTKLMELAQANLEVARTRAIEAGDTYGLSQIEALLTELRTAKQEVNNLSIEAQRLKLIELGALDTNQIKERFSGLDAQIKSAYEEYKKNIALANQATQAKKTGDANVYKNNAESLGKQIIQLNNERNKLIELFNKQGNLGEVKFNTVIDPAALEELNKLRNSMLDVVSQPLPQPIEVGKTAVSDAQQKRRELESIFSAPIVQSVSIRTETNTTQLPSLGELFGSTEEQLKSLGGFFRNVSIEGAAAGQVINTVGQQTKLTLDQLQKIDQLPPGQFIIEVNDEQGLPIEERLKRVQQLVNQKYTAKIEYVTTTLPDGFKTQRPTLIITPKVDAAAVASEGTKAGQVVAATAQTAVNASPLTIQAVSLSSLAPQLARDGIQIGRDLSANLRDGLEQQGVQFKIETVVDQTSIEGWKRQVQRLSADDGRISIRADTAELDQEFRRIDGQLAEWNRTAGNGLGAGFVNATQQAQNFGLLVDQVNQKMRAIQNPNALPPVKPVIEPVVEAKTAYQQVQEQLNQSNPITISADAAPMIGQIQHQLDQLRASGATKIEVTVDEKSGKLIVTADTSQAKGDVSALIASIRDNPVVQTVNVVFNVPELSLPTKTQYVDVVYRSSGSSSSSSDGEGRRWGGYISGYGGGDRIRALLEPGEFVLRKEAVKALGLSSLIKLNNLGFNAKIPKPSPTIDRVSIPRFANGGAVQGQPIVINIPGGKSIQVSGSRDSAMQLANLLTRVGRAV